MKKAIIISIIVSCIALSYLYPHTMLSPGELLLGHQNLNEKCLSCHKPFYGISNAKCISCHKLSEIGKDTLHLNDSADKKMKPLFHEQLLSQQCSSCHTDHKGLVTGKMSRFKHELLSASIISNCSSCHSEPMDSLHKQLSANCVSCHNTDGWKLASKFNHDMIQGTDKNNCISCHAAPKDAFHLTLVNMNCDKCHSNDKWKPSSFDHSSYFRLDIHHNVSCNTCHTKNNYVTYTCYGCHEHNESRIIAKHNEEGIYNISNCVSCHRSGNEHDTRMNGERNQQEGNKVKDFINNEKNNEHDDD